MSRASRYHCLALALFIVVSHTALAAHAATHTDNGGVVCQLCLCQAQQSHGLPAAVIHVAVVTGRTPQDNDLPAIEWARVIARAYDGRAPPSIA